MKIVAAIINYLVGVVFVVFGINFFLHFLPMPPMAGEAGTWVRILAESGFMAVVKIMEIVFGLMLLLNIKRPLAWMLLLPIITVIVMFEVFIAKTPGIGILLLAMNCFMIYYNRPSYSAVLS